MPPSVDTLLLRNAILLAWELRVLWITAAVALCSSLLYLKWLVSPSDKVGRWGSMMFRSGAALTVIAIALRTMREGWPPFQTPYDTLMWFALSASITYLIVERRLRDIFAAGCAISVTLVATFILASLEYPAYAVHAAPAYRGGWFMANLAATSIAYGVLAVAFSIEFGYAALTTRNLSRQETSIEMTARFHRFAHQLVLFGFPLLTVGIICGSLWQERMRGEYLPVEAKGILAVAIWTAYALYLHSMTMERWRGERAAMLNVLGFVIILLALFGIELPDLIAIPGFPGR